MVTQETARKYEVVEDLPGVGPSTADKLKELGFHTIESLATATIRELVPAGIGEKQAAKIIGSSRQHLTLIHQSRRADEDEGQCPATHHWQQGLRRTDRRRTGNSD